MESGNQSQLRFKTIVVQPPRLWCAEKLPAPPTGNRGCEVEPGARCKTRSLQQRFRQRVVAPTLWLCVVAIGWLGLLSATTALGGAVIATDEAGTLALDNGDVAVQFRSADGRVTARFAGTTGSVDCETAAYRVRPAQIVDVTISAVAGKAICIARADGDVDQFIVLPDVPLLCIRRVLSNANKDPRVVKDVRLESLRVDVAASLDDLAVLGCDGIRPARDKRTSYTFLAAATADAGNGVVAGWVTHHRGSGIVGAHGEAADWAVEGTCQYGNLQLDNGGKVMGEIFAVGRFANALNGLERLAALIAQLHRITLPAIPNGYCTWYSKPHGGAADAKAMAELAEFAGRNVNPYGFDTIQIDDRWQAGRRPRSSSGPNADFTRHDPQGPYPDGMQPTAELLRQHGIRPGIWLLPFAWYPEIPSLQDHPDWFVHKEDGSIYYVHWAGWCLDMTHPAARSFLGDTIKRITTEWGYKYLKLDGLWAGMAVKIRYPNPEVGPDNLGDAVFHDPTKTNIEAYRAGLATVRAAAGADVYLLGCNIAQNMRTLGASFGLLDGMRVGRDIGANWGNILPCVEMGSRLYWLHNRVWHNDPDCLMLRSPLTVEMARAWSSWIVLSGQLNMVSEWLPGLPAERLDIFKRSIPNTGLCGRPLDLFQQRTASVWHLSDARSGTRRDVIGLFNWRQDKPETLSVDLRRADLPADGSFVGFDYWHNRFLPAFQGPLTATLPAASCQVVAIRPVADHPQVVSTSRHIAQGIVDLVNEEWDADRGVLSGTSRVVGGDAYELRVVVPRQPQAWHVTSTDLSPSDRQAGVTIELKQTGPHLRAVVQSRETRAVRWSLAFDRKKAPRR